MDPLRSANLPFESSQIIWKISLHSESTFMQPLAERCMALCQVKKSS